MTNRSVRLANPALLPRVVGMLHCVTVRGRATMPRLSGTRGRGPGAGKTGGGFYVLTVGVLCSVGWCEDCI